MGKRGAVGAAGFGSVSLAVALAVTLGVPMAASAAK